MDIVKTILKSITQNVSKELLFVIGGALILLIIVSMIARSVKRRKANARYEELAQIHEEVKTNSLDYKFNKAKAFAKSNVDIMDRMRDLTPKVQVCLTSLQTCQNLADQANQLLDRHRVKKAMRIMDEWETSLSDAQERIRIVTKALENLLEKENEARDFSNTLKERFHTVKTVYQTNRANFYQSTTFFDSRIQEIENEFSHFEEWMAASEFNKAREEGKRISSEIDVLSSQIAAMPGYYEQAKKELPQAFNEVAAQIKDARRYHVDLSYLEVDKEVEVQQANLSQAVNLLNVGNIDQAALLLSEMSESLANLQKTVAEEKDAYIEIHDGLEANVNQVGKIADELDEVKTLYANIKDRFGLEDWTTRFSLMEEQIVNLNKASELIQTELAKESISNVDMLDYYRQFARDVVASAEQMQEMKKHLVGASTDESRAKKQLVKLQLILNEVRLNASIRQLPTISDQFEKDMVKAEELIERVQVVLSHSPLDVQTLNDDLQEAIDFVYKLYNKANNLMGVALMVENAIVFGNRFRSSYPSMDSDLTRAEICFQNGEYTRALKIAIQAIENLHPGTYEKLIARKDPAVMNQQ